jgi:DNA polymerase-3 subunit epsilon
VFNFGKHAGSTLENVADTDRSYLEWMLTQDFLDDVRSLVRRTLAIS